MNSSELIFLKQNLLYVLPGDFFKKWDEILLFTLYGGVTIYVKEFKLYWLKHKQ